MTIRLLINRIIFSISFLLIITGSIHGSLASPENSTLDSQGNYANPSLGVSFQAPLGWTVEEPKKSDPTAPDVAVIAPYSSGFTASISLFVAKSNGTSLDDYVKNKEAQLTSNQSNNTVLLSKLDTTINGLPAKVSLLQENFSSQGTYNTIEFKQTVIQSNDKFFTITYANNKTNFDSDLSSYDQLLTSIKFGNDGTSSLLDYLSAGIVGITVVVGIAIMRKKHNRKRTHSRRQS